MLNWQQILNRVPQSEQSIHPHCKKEQATLFSSFYPGSVELEVMDVLYGLVRLFKPHLVLDTGTHYGLSALAMGLALRENEVGKLISVEMDEVFVRKANELIKNNHLGNIITIVNQNSLTYISNLSKGTLFDFGFFDSETATRIDEFHLLRQKGLLRGLAVFHDTSPMRTKTYTPANENQSLYIKRLDEIQKGCRGSLECFYSRGLRIFQLL